MAVRIASLKASDNHFAKLTGECHELTHAETLVETMSQSAETDLRKKRAALKDERWSLLQKVAYLLDAWRQVQESERKGDRTRTKGQMQRDMDDRDER